MRLATACRAVCVTLAFATAIVGLCFQATSTPVDTSVGQDFIVLQQNVSKDFERSLANTASATKAETLTDWSFTARTRPLKCRFVN